MRVTPGGGNRNSFQSCSVHQAVPGLLAQADDDTWSEYFQEPHQDAANYVLQSDGKAKKEKKETIKRKHTKKTDGYERSQ